MELDHAQLCSLLPHRHPMLLLDRVTSVDVGRSLIAIKAISACEPCYADVPESSPGTAYAYPASLLIESFGQGAAVLWLLGARSAGQKADGVPMFTAARDCRLESPVYPGDLVCHEVTLDHAVEGAAFATGSSWVGHRQVATFGSMMAVIRPPEAVLVSNAPRQRDGTREGQRNE
jgi:3-hydroxyacyl-[acyl-carrier-protein] dehydratase